MIFVEQSRDKLPAEIEEVILNEGPLTVARFFSSKEQSPLLLKLLDLSHSRKVDLDRLKNEYTLTHKLTELPLIPALKLEFHENTAVLELTPFEGRPISPGPWPLETFFPFAIQLCRALAKIHSESIIHRDLRPQNIWLNLPSGEIRLTGFGLASHFPRSSRQIEGHPAYMSPEQTGRIDRASDTRSDLYSLGVIFFQLISGELPFAASDILEWIHCHLAMNPPTLLGVPQPLAKLVAQLLAKSPEDRYQSAAGLCYDLEQIWSHWKQPDFLNRFKLGQRDHLGQLHFADKIFGRESELRGLQEAFSKAHSDEPTEFCLISGYGGIGKSSLVAEFRKSLQSKNHLFMSGKFDAQEGDKPYSAVARTLDECLKAIYLGAPGPFKKLKARISGTLGQHARLLKDLAPHLEYFLEAQLETCPLPPLESRVRLSMLFRHLLGALASHDAPLVIFFDDLQWADAGSLSLLQEAILDAELRNVLFLGAYRENELEAHHPLSVALEQMRKMGASIHKIPLAPLSLSQVELFISDSLQCDSTSIQKLAKLLHDHTAGNPLFLKQLLIELHHERLLWHDPLTNAWQWKLEQIGSRAYADNVIDFLIDHMERLPQNAREVLKFAACAGHTLDLLCLDLISKDQLIAGLNIAISENLLICQEGFCHFPHDRIREAAEALLSAEDLKATHLQIGRRLQALPNNSQLLFEITKHLNLGAALIIDPDEKQSLIDLNIQAARKAMSTAAFSSAETLFDAALSLLKPGSAAFQVQADRLRCLWAQGKLDLFEKNLPALSITAQERSEHVLTCLFRIQLCTSKGETWRGVQTALETLSKHLSRHLPEMPSAEFVNQTFSEVKSLLEGIKTENLLHLPPMKDELIRETAAVLVAACPCAFYSAKPLLCDLLICELARLSMQHGNSPTEESSIGYVMLGAIFRARGYPDEAIKLGQVARELALRTGRPRARGIVESHITTFLTVWMRPPQVALLECDKACRDTSAAGEAGHESFMRGQMGILAFAAGLPLGQVLQRAANGVDFHWRATLQPPYGILEDLDALVHQLQDLPAKSKSPRRLETPLTQTYQCLFHLIQYYLFGNYREAAALVPKIHENVDLMRSHPALADFIYYSFLALAAAHQEHPLLEPLLKQARSWQFTNSSLEARRWLMEAEWARLQGAREEAEGYYAQAIQCADLNGYVHYKAIAHECAASFFKDPRISEEHLRQARSSYLLWGAHAKVRLLDQRFKLPTTLSEVVTPEQVDLLAVAKATQAISSKIEQQSLFSELLRVVLEQSGAQTAYLILERQGQLSIEAKATLEPLGIRTQRVHAQPIHTSPLVPESIIQHVWAKQTKIILGDATNDPGLFTNDTYITRTQPRSLLCLPIRHQNTTLGILYLENNAISFAFTPERLVILELLASQATISLQNAELFEAVRHENAERQKAERERERLLEHEKKARQELETAMRLRENFFMLASHELRTPLTPLKIYLEIFQHEIQDILPESSPRREILTRALSTALRSFDQFSKLIEDLLDVSRILAKKMNLHLEAVDLSALVNSVIKRFAHEIDRSRSPIHTQIEVKVIGHCDRIRIEQAISNLLSNALKYGAHKPIEITLSAQHENVILSIRDHGIGLAPEDQTRIFERFVRATPAAHYGGLGLGLFLTREIIEAHGGHIQIKSEVGQGSCFEIQIPLAQPLPLQQQPATPVAL